MIDLIVWILAGIGAVSLIVLALLRYLTPWEFVRTKDEKNI